MINRRSMVRGSAAAAEKTGSAASAATTSSMGNPAVTGESHSEHVRVHWPDGHNADEIETVSD